MMLDATHHPTSHDTTPEAEAVLLALLRTASPARKWAMVGQMNRTVRTLALAGLRQRHPVATDAQLRRYLADIVLGEALAEKVYGVHV